MSESRPNPFVIELKGSVSGAPRVIEMDVKSVLAKRAEREGRPVTDEELELQSLALVDDLQRTQEVIATPRSAAPLRGILSSIIKR